MLMVSDSGSGIDQQIMKNIFEPFFTTKNNGEGTGLGLATVYGIVKQNQGFIKVYSELGHGTTFRVYLPAHQEEEITRVESTITQIPRAKAGERILLVEDEPSILELAKFFLEDLGYSVLAANSPEKALEIGAEEDSALSLLISDVIMPHMNGRDLAAKILESRPLTKCLFMSGYTADVIASQGVLDPHMHFLPKPFTKKELALKVREALDS